MLRNYIKKTESEKLNKILLKSIIGEDKKFNSNNVLFSVFCVKNYHSNVFNYFNCYDSVAEYSQNYIENFKTSFSMFVKR